MDPGASPLLTDLYQLNMIEAYLARSIARKCIGKLAQCSSARRVLRKPACKWPY